MTNKAKGKLRQDLMEAVRAQRELQPSLEKCWQEEAVPGADLEEIRSRLVAEYEREKERLDTIIVRIVGLLEPRAGDVPLEIFDVWVQTYRSQGFGAVKYAESKADMIAMEAANATGGKVATRVEKVYSEKGSGGPMEEPISFKVLAHVKDESDIVLIGLKPHWPLREAVRQCWSRGVNPRVYNPGLPHGYEESEGLDFFGRDLRAESEA